MLLRGFEHINLFYFIISNILHFVALLPPPLLVISFDGFRYDYLDIYDTPNFHRLADFGVRAKWMTSVFVTKTFPNHFSIITGLYEESHGIVGNYMFDPLLNETFHSDNVDPKWWYNGVSNPIWVANQKADPKRHSGAVMWLSTNVPYFGQSIKYHENFNTTNPWENRIDIALRWITADKDPANFVLLYIEEPDQTGHIYGPESPEVGAKVIQADKLIGYLLDKLEEKKLLDGLNIIILSDHGMVSVPSQNVIFLDSILSRSMYTQFGHSPVWQILPNPGQQEAVYSKLVEGSYRFSYKVYKKDSIPNDFHFKNNRRIMPFFVSADEGWDLAFNRSSFWPNSNYTGARGNHGYNNSLMSMHPIFLAHGPSFKKGFVAEPFLNLDVYPLMCHVLGINIPTGINGTLNGIGQILANGSWLNSISGTWIIAGITLLCLCLAGALTGAVISAACQKRPPTISFVPLNQKFIYRDEPYMGEEGAKLLE